MGLLPSKDGSTDTKGVKFVFFGFSIGPKDEL
jgi:hypothetical protein